MNRKLTKSLARIFGVVFAIVCFAWLLVAQPTTHTQPPSQATVAPDRLKAHVQVLSETFHPRNWQNTQNLDRCAAYITRHFIQAGARVSEQAYKFGDRQYRNVIGKFGSDTDQRLVIGAHYDTCENTPGADDNASGVAALIELGYLLGQQPSNPAIELVAYTLEEPPFFRTAQMGSAMHANMLATQKIPVRGVIVFEMVGYYRDEPWTQSYPALLLHLMYPSRGNFVGVIGRWDQGDWIKKIKMGMKGTTPLPVYSIRAPAALPGVDFSDHLNYWSQGFQAVMLTDTAFYRNEAYHGTNDIPNRLDYTRLGNVVIATFETIKHL